MMSTHLSIYTRNQKRNTHLAVTHLVCTASKQCLCITKKFCTCKPAKSIYFILLPWNEVLINFYPRNWFSMDNNFSFSLPGWLATRGKSLCFPWLLFQINELKTNTIEIKLFFNFNQETTDFNSSWQIISIYYCLIDRFCLLCF